jgi:hypothetical protein
MPGVQQLRAFGLTIASDVPLPPLPGASGGGSLPDVRLTADDAGEVAAMSDLTPVWRSTFPDGSVVLAEVAPGGAQRLTFGERAAFRVSADGGSVACRFARADDPGALRFLLDTVLWWVSLTHGYEILHASAVALPGGVFAIASHSGGGTTTLAVELVRRGHLPKARFDAVSDIARIAPVFRLSAALDETPASLARNVEGVASQATGGCMIDV